MRFTIALAAIAALTVSTLCHAQFTQSIIYGDPPFDGVDVPSATTMEFDQYDGPGVVTQVIIESNEWVSTPLFRLANGCNADTDVLSLHDRGFTLTTAAGVLQDRTLDFTFELPGVLGDGQLLDGQARTWFISDGFWTYGAVPSDEWIGSGTVEVTLTEQPAPFDTFPACVEQTSADSYAIAVVSRLIFVEFQTSHLLELLAAWGPTSSEYDLNEDGSTDFGDLIILLSNWGDGQPAPIAPPITEYRIEATALEHTEQG